MNDDTPYILAFDLGSTKIIGAVAQKTEEGLLNIIAYEEEATKENAIKKGTIFNISDTAFHINSIVTKLRNKSKLNLTKAYVGLGGEFLQCTYNITKRILGTDEIVTDSLIETLYQENFKLHSPKFEILDVITQEFLVDDELISNPVGIDCTCLEGRYKIIHTKSLTIQSFEKVRTIIKEKSNIEIIGTLTAPIATANGLITSDEKELGCMVIDFGGGTTSYSLFTKGYLREAGIIPLGGKTVTNDIRELNLLESQAEKLKKKLGSALACLEVPDKKIIIARAENQNEEKSVQSSFLAEIIEARVTEIVNFFLTPLQQKGYFRQLGAGIVITGGGSQLNKINELMRSLTGLDVRNSIGNHLLDKETMPEAFMNPAYSQIVGLLSMGTENCITEEKLIQKEEKGKKVKQQATSEKTGFKSRIYGLVDGTTKRLVTLFDDKEESI